MSAVEYSETPTVAAVEITNADTQYPYVIPDGTKAIQFRTRDGAALRFAYASGKVASPTDPYHTLAANGLYSKDKLWLNKTTIYFACAAGGKVVEVLTWQ
jgi:hypothetical protein